MMLAILGFGRISPSFGGTSAFWHGLATSPSNPRSGLPSPEVPLVLYFAGLSVPVPPSVRQKERALATPTAATSSAGRGSSQPLQSGATRRGIASTQAEHLDVVEHVGPGSEERLGRVHTKAPLSVMAPLDLLKQQPCRVRRDRGRKGHSSGERWQGFRPCCFAGVSPRSCLPPRLS